MVLALREGAKISEDKFQGSVNGVFQTVVRVFWGKQIPLPPFLTQLNLLFTSILPLFNLFFTFFEPQFNLCFVTKLEPRFGNHGFTDSWKWGKLFYLQLELFCLQLGFFAYSSLRCLLDTLSHCKQKSSNCKQKS